MLDSNKKNNIRQANLNDVSAIHRLCIQLGYEPSIEDVRSNLNIILNHQDYEVVVIEINQNIVGWMTLLKRFLIEDKPFLQIAALVTDENYRRQGFGKFLMNYAENKAKDLGFKFVGLNSSKRRKEAHLFYENLGYTRLKESYFFRREL